MPPNLISAGLLILSLIIYLYACKILIEDARHNYSLTMGAEMYFSQLWVIASVLAACGTIRLLHLSWWLLPPARQRAAKPQQRPRKRPSSTSC